jgi:hypothetical protein
MEEIHMDRIQVTTRLGLTFVIPLDDLITCSEHDETVKTKSGMELKPLWSCEQSHSEMFKLFTDGLAFVFCSLVIGGLLWMM